MNIEERALNELLVRLEQAGHEAGQFVLVTTDRVSGAVIHATGPFEQAEQALAQAGEEERDWLACGGEDELGFVVVPLWAAA